MYKLVAVAVVFYCVLLVLYMILNYSSLVSNLIEGQSATDIDDVEDNFGCLLTNRRDNIWKLVWEDKFEDDRNLDKDWNVKEDTKMSEVKETQVCFRRNNVRYETTNGYLMLVAKQETYLSSNYTGAEIFTKRTFGEGRFEIRAALPLGEEMRFCFEIINNLEKGPYNWTSYITVYCSILALGIGRHMQVVSIVNPTTKNYYYSAKRNSGTLQNFHRYGVEWTKRKILFFSDDIYSKEIHLNESHALLPKQRIFLDVSVGANRPQIPLQEHFSDLNSNCPIVFLNYVRVYQKVTNQNELTIQSSNFQCDFGSVCLELFIF